MRQYGKRWVTMRVRELITALKPLEGWRILVLPNDGPIRRQACRQVMYLPPDQRNGDQGNVILFNGNTDDIGRPGGLTMMARNVLAVVWLEERKALVMGRDGTKAEVYLVARLE